VDVIGGRGGQRKRRVARVGPRERRADVLLPEFTEVAELCLPGGHARGADPSGRGGKLVMSIDLSEIHENILADEALSIVVGEERNAVRGDAGDDVGVVEAHATKGRWEAFLVIRLASVTVNGWVVGHALGDGRGIVKGGMIRRVTKFRGRNGSRIAIVDGVAALVSKVVRV